MQPLPVKVKNVTIYPYVDMNPISGIGPVIPPVIVDASGTYSVGTLTTNIFYNLNLESGEHLKELEIHGQYVAVGQFEDGRSFTSTWMYCTQTGEKAKFGRTVSAFGDSPEPHGLNVSTPDYIVLKALTDITVSQLFPPPAIGQAVLISNGSGHVIGTKVGTPHLMGVEVNGGERSALLKPGMKRVMVTGKTADGDTLSMGNLTCCSANEPAVFLQTWP